MEYIEGPKAGECIFCDVPGSDRSDRERLILHRGGQARIMLNRYPYSIGHLMVVPEAHVGRLYDLDAATRDDLWARVADSSRILDDLLGCEGQNIGVNLGVAGGAGFGDHVHVHLVPRWRGDTSYMTAVGELRVIPEHLERTWEKLAPRFAELGRP
jgi:ATP adenylyltransferase